MARSERQHIQGGFILCISTMQNVGMKVILYPEVNEKKHLKHAISSAKNNALMKKLPYSNITHWKKYNDTNRIIC